MNGTHDPVNFACDPEFPLHLKIAPAAPLQAFLGAFFSGGSELPKGEGDRFRALRMAHTVNGAG